MATFWLIFDECPLSEQPIAFLGSEGEMAVVAENLAKYLWLLADGLGPMEACCGSPNARPDAAFVAFASEHAPDAKASAAVVLERVREQSEALRTHIGALCR